MSIGLSGLPGAGKNTVGSMLAKRLGWKFYSFGQHLREQHKKELDEKKTTLPFEKWWCQSPQTLKESNNSFRELLSRGNLIGDSRYIVANVKGLKIPTVYLYAPLAVRARRIFERGDYETDVIEIEKKLLAREKDEIRIGHALFDDSIGGSFDYTQAHYTKRIDTSLYTPEEIVNQILEMIEEDKF